MKSYIKLLTLVATMNVVSGLAFADGESNLVVLKRELSALSTDEDPNSGQTVWKVGSRIVHQSWHGVGPDQANFSPDGKSVHFGSIKQDTKRRVIVAFNVKSGHLNYCGGDELPEKIILALLNSGKVPSNTPIVGCWVDPVKWLDNSKLLVNSYLESQRSPSYEVKNFYCVWNLEDGTCEYLPEHKSDKETIVSSDSDNKIQKLSTPPPASNGQSVEGSISPDSESLVDVNASSEKPGGPFYLASIYRIKSGGVFSLAVDSKMTTLVYETGRGTHDTGGYFGPYNDNQIAILYSIVTKFLEWDRLALKTLPPSFNKPLPFSAQELWRNEGLNSIPKKSVIVEYLWVNEQKKEQNQDSFGAALSGIAGETPAVSGSRSTLHLEISSHDRAWGNNLSAQEGRNFKTIIEQIPNCRARFIKLNAVQQLRLNQEHKRDDEIKSQFK